MKGVLFQSSRSPYFTYCIGKSQGNWLPISVNTSFDTVSILQYSLDIKMYNGLGTSMLAMFLIGDITF